MAPHGVIRQASDEQVDQQGLMHRLVRERFARQPSQVVGKLGKSLMSSTDTAQQLSSKARLSTLRVEAGRKLLDNHVVVIGKVLRETL